MSDLRERTFLVTGANSGVGLAVAQELASRGGRVYLACRSAGKAAAAAAAVTAAAGPGGEVFTLPLDLADLESVRGCAAAFLDRDEPLHVLVNNAGVSGPEGLTRQGFELAFGVNHLGHFLLTALLLPRLAASGPARVVTVASGAHFMAKGIDFAALRPVLADPSEDAGRDGGARDGGGVTFEGLRQYAVSKLCNVLFTQELARRAAGTGVTAYAAHPGTVASGMWAQIPGPVPDGIGAAMVPAADGAATPLYCATSPQLAGASGGYYDKCAEKAPSAVATVELAAELWRHSQDWTAAWAGECLDLSVS